MIESEGCLASLIRDLELVNVPPSNDTEDGAKSDCINTSSDHFRMFKFKVDSCPLSEPSEHDWTTCPFAHPGEKAQRRDPRKFRYGSSICLEFRKGTCKLGDACPSSHGVFESWLHPEKYRTKLCKDAGACGRLVCFFAHGLDELRNPETGPGSDLPAPPQDSLPVSTPTESEAEATPGLGHGRDIMNKLKDASCSLSPHIIGSFFESNSSMEGSVHGSSRKSLFDTHLAMMGGHSQSSSATVASALHSSVSLSGLLDAFGMQDSTPPPPPPRVPSCYIKRQASAPLDIFTSPASPLSSMMMSPLYPSTPASLPPQALFPIDHVAQPPDMTHPLLAGALQAGVLHQVLAQLTPQQLAMLSHQQPQTSSYVQMSPMPYPSSYQQSLNHFASVLAIPQQHYSYGGRRSSLPGWN